MTRHTPINTIIEINDFISLYRNRMGSAEVNRLNTMTDMLTAGNLSEADAKSLLSEVRQRVTQ